MPARVAAWPSDSEANGRTRSSPTTPSSGKVADRRVQSRLSLPRRERSSASLSDSGRRRAASEWPRTDRNPRQSICAHRQLRRRYRLPGQIQIQCASYVHPVGGREEPERAANTRVHVQYFVSSVAPVIAVSDIENSLIPDRLHEFYRCLFDRPVV